MRATAQQANAYDGYMLKKLSELVAHLEEAGARVVIFQVRLEHQTLCALLQLVKPCPQPWKLTCWFLKLSKFPGEMHNAQNLSSPCSPSPVAVLCVAPLPCCRCMRPVAEEVAVHFLALPRWLAVRYYSLVLDIIIQPGPHLWTCLLLWFDF